MFSELSWLHILKVLTLPVTMVAVKHVFQITTSNCFGGETRSSRNHRKGKRICGVKADTSHPLTLCFRVHFPCWFTPPPFFFFLFSPRSHDPWSSINHKGASHCRAKETTWDRIDGVKESEIAGGDHDSTGERGGAESDNLSRFPRSKFHTLHPSYAPCHTPSHAVFFFFFLAFLPYTFTKQSFLGPGMVEIG